MEQIPIGILTLALQVLGLPGLVVAFWWVESRDRRKERAEFGTHMDKVLSQYKSDVCDIKVLYENNCILVENYQVAFQRLENLYRETISVISLNTQAQTRLADYIKAMPGGN